MNPLPSGNAAYASTPCGAACCSLQMQGIPWNLQLLDGGWRRYLWREDPLATCVSTAVVCLHYSGAIPSQECFILTSVAGRRVTIAQGFSTQATRGSPFSTTGTPVKAGGWGPSVLRCTHMISVALTPVSWKLPSYFPWNPPALTFYLTNVDPVARRWPLARPS